VRCTYSSRFGSLTATIGIAGRGQSPEANKFHNWQTTANAGAKRNFELRALHHLAGEVHENAQRHRDTFLSR
jgi:hypothetical protein